MKKHISTPYPTHFDGSRFFNPDVPNIEKSFFDLLKWQLVESSTPWPQHVDIVPRTPYIDLSQEEVGLTLINHATYLIQLEKASILTDPIYSLRCSPISWAGSKRVHLPGVAFDQLPQIDVVTISHNHYDHLDIPTLKLLAARSGETLFVVPIGDKSLLEKHGIMHVQELDWGESIVLPQSHITIHFEPAQHWSSRGIRDRRKSLWGSYVIETTHGKKIYHAGDTGYGLHFSQIFERHGSMDVSLLPIGAYDPRWFLKEQHMDPEEAVQAHIDLHARRSFPMHFGTFKLTNEGLDDPITALRIAKEHYSKTNTGVDSFEEMHMGESKRIVL